VSAQAEPTQTGDEDRRFPAYLGFTAGVVDAAGWLTLGGLFTAHITGNLVVIAAAALDGRNVHPMQIASLPVFVLVAALIGFAATTPRMSKRLEEALLAMQLALLLCAGALAQIAHASQDPYGLKAGIVAVLAVTAMASQNALLHLSRERAPATAVMTGNLIVITLSLVAALTAPGARRSKALTVLRSTWPILVGFLLGCAVGAAAVRLWADGAWFVAASATAAIWRDRRQLKT
jgi:uncharacterized membrane protein YoaK (UPF0700 family)